MVHLLTLSDSVQGGATALYVAAQNGHVEAVGLLVAANAQLNIQHKVRFTACLLVIINFGCVQEDGGTALHIASQEGHCEVVKMLVMAGANVNIKSNVSHAAWWCLCTPWLSAEEDS